MPDPLAHSTDMITIRPNKMPTLWWLFPWAYARTLHMSANAVKAYADHQDEIVDNQRQTIRHLMAENYRLQQRVRDQDDAIIKGTAITPDARPYHAASERLQDEAEARGDDLSSHV
jgi:hypothetical protein